MCMYLECTLIWVGVTLIPDIYGVSMTHIGIWAALLCFVLFEGYGPMSGASMSPARTFAYFVAGGFTAARGMMEKLIFARNFRCRQTRHLLWRRGCLCVCYVDVLCPND